MSESPEAALIQEAQSGNAEARDRLVRDHYPTVLALTRRMLGKEAEARDAAQETFARAFAHLDGFDPRKRFSAWVLTIAANHVRDLFRRRHGVPLSSEVEESLPELTPPDARLLQEENRSSLLAAVDRLAFDLKIVVHLVFHEELSYTEIGDALGLTVNAVRIRLFRALSILRDALKKEFS